MERNFSRRAMLAIVVMAGAMAVAGCKILPIADEAEAEGAKFDAVAYAKGVWSDKGLAHITSSAKPLPEVLAAIKADFAAATAQYGYRAAGEGSPWIFVVSGSGTVSKKNTESRAGTLSVALDGATPPVEVDIQIGPVIRGTAIRDSLPFVPFKDFTNQLEFADVGKAFTALAMEAVSADATAIGAGQAISFTGAMSLNTGADKIVITPVSLKGAP